MDLILPDSPTFADLQLERKAEGGLLFLPAPLAELARLNGMDPDATLADEDLSCWLICEWYVAHREVRGEPDPVAEEFLAEAAANLASEMPMLQGGGGLAH